MRHREGTETDDLKNLFSSVYLLRTLMDSVPDSIYFKDKASRFIRINQALAKRLGLTHPGQALGKTDFDFFSEEHARQAYADEQEVMGSAQSLIGKEEKETWPDGREAWVSTTKIPLRDENGSAPLEFQETLPRASVQKKLLERTKREPD
jgi:PAS domain S-box-containing protein